MVTPITKWTLTKSKVPLHSTKESTGTPWGVGRTGGGVPVESLWSPWDYWDSSGTPVGSVGECEIQDVAGTGKSAIAHTVAQNCFYKGVLASSFFFDRNIPDQRTPVKLFSTIAHDLVWMSNDPVRHVSQILENDRSVAILQPHSEGCFAAPWQACGDSYWCIGRRIRSGDSRFFAIRSPNFLGHFGSLSPLAPLTISVRIY